MLTVQALIQKLDEFWATQGCTLHHGHDVETGAGTFNPATFFRCLGPEPYRAAYVEPSRRPSDGRYGENPNRMQAFHQYQVVIKPSPFDIQQVYLQSLEAIGFDLSKHDIRFVHDDWEQPSLGAWGLGWEVWRDGMEVTQFTYFQSVAGIELSPITVELTYGIERIAMSVQGVDSVWDLKWSDTLTYHDIFHAGEVEWSAYNFEAADVEMWHRHFEGFEAEAKRLVERKLAIPAYDFVMKASHAFNLLDARGVISVTERTGYIQRLRDLAHKTALGYLEGRERLGTPLLTRQWPKAQRPPVTKEPAPAAGGPPEDFILEIGSEELPAAFVPAGARSLASKMSALLDEHGLAHEVVQIYATPRRLTAHVQGLAKEKPAEKVERRGPRVAAAYPDEEPSRAAQGFFKSLGLEPPKRSALESTPGIEIRADYLYATIEKPAEATAKTLAEHLPKLILGLEFPKQMRWGDGDITYARPLHWIVALHGTSVIPFQVGDIHSGRTSSAHAQLCPGTFPIGNAADYLETLRAHKVMADVVERRLSIETQLEQVTDLKPLAVEWVLPEVLHLTEWPQLTVAQFDPTFLEIPQEVLISEMVHHQRYFPLSHDGSLSNSYIITADNTPSDEIRHGNTKVLSARLSDGRFLYTQDLKTPLEAFNEKLKAITFRQQIGSVYDKALRVTHNVAILHSHLPIADLATAQRAASLSKADIASELVGEFPELQGIVGRHYALAHGEVAEVAQAIDEGWMPRGENAPLPASPAGTLVSLADKLDNLISCFALGLRPTSSSDPYALRRQVLAIVRMLIENEYSLPLRETLSACYAGFCTATGLKADETVVPEILDFFAGRIRTVFEAYGLSRDETSAALAAGFNDIYDRFLSARALHVFRTTSEHFGLLTEVYKRASGLLEGEEGAPLDPSLLSERAEIALHQSLISIEEGFHKALEQADYQRAFSLIAELQPPLAGFFDEVRVLDQDPSLQANRLALLRRVFGLFSKLLDFSALNLG